PWASTSTSGSSATSAPSGRRTRPRSPRSSSSAIYRCCDDLMEPLLLFPDPAPPPVAQALDLGGWAWKAVAGPDAASRLEPDEGWAGALVCAEDDPDGAFALCRTLRKRDLPLEPLLLLVPASRLADLELREDLFDDFCVTPFHPVEFEARLKHLFWRTGRG